MELSLIVPLYNEEESVVPLYEAISAAVRPLGIRHEILFVDDGSSDNTFGRARELALRDPNLRIIRFRRNFGQTPAMAAGIDHARGRVLVTMDGDLQNDPRDIPLLLEKIEAGYDLAVGWRQKRQDKLVSRKIPSRIANWIIGKVTGVPIKDNGCSLKAYRADVIKGVPLYSEMHRFIPAMSSVTGARIAEVPVRHHARRFGQSKYGLSRIYKVLIDLLTIKTLVTFTARPMWWFGSLGAMCLAVALVTFLTALGRILIPDDLPIVIAAGLSMLFAELGIFLIFSGVLSELIYKTGTLNIAQMARTTADRHVTDHAPAAPATRT